MECEIFKLGEDLNNEVVEGLTLRNYTDEERVMKIVMIKVMAKSSLFDKIFMV